MNLPPALKTDIARQMRHDIKFLAVHGLMDYSLLLGVKKRAVRQQAGLHDSKQGTQRTRVGHASRGKFDGALSAEVVEGPGVYYVGIIDILQRWTLAKKVERLAKIVFRCLWQQRDGQCAARVSAALLNSPPSAPAHVERRLLTSHIIARCHPPPHPCRYIGSAAVPVPQAVRKPCYQGPAPARP